MKIIANHIATFLLMFTSIWAFGQNQEEHTFILDHYGAAFNVTVLVRTAGTNSNPQLQFRVEKNSAELTSFSYNGNFYLFNDLYGIIAVYEDVEIPRYYASQFKIYLEDAVAALGYTCETQDFLSNTFWVTEDAWTTISINDQELINCLRTKEAGFWREYGHTRAYSDGYSSYERGYGMRIAESDIGINISQFRKAVTSYEEREGGNNTARDVLDDYCNRNYSSESQIREAMGAVNRALGEDISQQWVREALQNCRTSLQEQLNDMASQAQDDLYDSPHDKYAAYGDAAFSQGNYQQAWQYYRTALNYEDNYYTRQKRDEAYKKWEEQRAIQGAAHLVEGVADMRESAPTGRLNGTFFSSFGYGNYNYSRIPGVRFNNSYHSGYMLASFDYNTWFNSSRSVGWHYGIYGQLDFLPGVEGNSRDLQGMDKAEWGIYTGINLFGYIEIDYILRGLSMNGEVYGFDSDLDEYYTRNIGGGMSYDGGVRVAVYLLNQREDFVRFVGYYINSYVDSPIGFLDFTGGENSTQSMGYRVEWGHSPLSFYFFHSTDSYYPAANSIPMGVDTWGIGIGWGTGFDD
ncbi:MAG: hypothetical protein HWE14_11165 [Flavobacteriia bacterium]|nr:hypothetical protein [Flavobacteriia bacterium]